MGGLWWSDLRSFERDLASADVTRLREMFDWASQRERESDQAGRGRNPKARRMFRQMSAAAAQRLEERGQLSG